MHLGEAAALAATSASSAGSALASSTGPANASRITSLQFSWVSNVKPNETVTLADGRNVSGLVSFNISFPHPDYAPDLSHPDYSLRGLQGVILLVMLLSAVLTLCVVLRIYSKLALGTWRGFTDWAMLGFAVVASAESVIFTNMCAVGVYMLQNAQGMHWMMDETLQSTANVMSSWKTFTGLWFLATGGAKWATIELIWKIMTMSRRRITPLRLIIIALVFEATRALVEWILMRTICVPGVKNIPNMEQLSLVTGIHWHCPQRPTVPDLGVYAWNISMDAWVFFTYLFGSYISAQGWLATIGSIAVTVVSLRFKPKGKRLDGLPAWYRAATVLSQVLNIQLVLIADTLLDIPALMKGDHPLTPTAFRRAWRRCKNLYRWVLRRPIPDDDKKNEDAPENEALLTEKDYEEMNEAELDERARMIGRRILGLEARDRRTQIAPRPPQSP